MPTVDGLSGTRARQASASAARTASAVNLTALIISKHREDEDMTKANGATVTDLTALKKCMKGIEGCLDELAYRKATYMNDCKVIRNEMASIFMRAKDDGVNIRAVKTLVKTRILQEQADKTVAALDIDQLASYRQYREAAEAWDTTPLGKTAKKPQPEAVL
jgi:hypothetical protein